MRFGWIVLLLLSCPVLEAIGIFWAAGAIGSWVLLWLLLVAAGIIKMPLYAQLGVIHLWLIDPILPTLEAYQLHDSHWLLIGTIANDQAVSIAPFAEHTFLLSDLWE